MRRPCYVAFTSIRAFGELGLAADSMTLFLLNPVVRTSSLAGVNNSSSVAVYMISFLLVIELFYFAWKDPCLPMEVGLETE